MEFDLSLSFEIQFWKCFCKKIGLKVMVQILNFDFKKRKENSIKLQKNKVGKAKIGG